MSEMITLESWVAEPDSIDAERDDRRVVEYDARFQAVRDRLVRVCAGLVGADAAEDVVHDAYLRGRDRFSQLRNVDLFDGWVTRIAVNLCLNRHRSGRRLRDLLVSLRRNPQSMPRDAGLRDLIERLPPRERTVVVLHYGYGYRLDEIAQMSGLTSTNVRSIVFRARRRLGSQLQEGSE